MHLHNAFWKMEVGVGTTNARHVAVYNGTELVLHCWIQATGFRPAIGDERAGEHSRNSEGVLMATGDREEVNKGIESAETILNRRRREHEDVFKRPIRERFPKPLRDLSGACSVP